MDREKMIKTIPLLLKYRVDETPDDIAYMEKDGSGVWQGLTWQQHYKKVLSLGSGFINHSLETGDQIAIFLPNGILWEVAQQAAYLSGCVVVGLDKNDPLERLLQIIELSQIKAIVIPDFDILETMPQKWLTSMKLILSIKHQKKPDEFPQAMCMDELKSSTTETHFPVFDGACAATIIFTSGTTGYPKAIGYDHDQILAAIYAITRQLASIPDQASSACWLPLSNPFQRISNLCAIQKNWRAYMISDPSKIVDESKEIRPYFFTAVPRFYEKIYDGIEQKINALPFFLRQGLRMAICLGSVYQGLKRAKSPLSLILKIPNQMVDYMFFKNIRSILGENVQYFISGSAPMPQDLLKRFHSMGWLILEAYGVSENIVPMSMNTLEDYCFGTVGRPLKENNLKITAEGEICVKGVGVVRKGVDLTEDGYLRTGDLGSIDKEGCLKLVGRKSDGFKLSTGRKISPVIIESALKEIMEVTHAVVAGANQKYLVALLNIEDNEWTCLSQRFQTQENILEYLEKEMYRSCKKLPGYCHPVDFAVIRKTFTVKTGELTGNLKLRRKQIIQNYQNIILDLYSNKTKENSKVVGKSINGIVLDETN